MSELSYLYSLGDLEEVLAKNENVVVVFSARDWCVPCQRLHPHVEAAAQQMEGFTFVDIDIDKVEGVKEEFGIMSVPQVWYYEDVKGGLAGREIKARTALQLITEIKRD